MVMKTRSWDLSCNCVLILAACIVCWLYATLHKSRRETCFKRLLCFCWNSILIIYSVLFSKNVRYCTRSKLIYELQLRIVNLFDGCSNVKWQNAISETVFARTEHSSHIWMVVKKTDYAWKGSGLVLVTVMNVEILILQLVCWLLAVCSITQLKFFYIFFKRN